MDRLEAMSILIAAVESGSLSAASRKLNVPLTVSRKVAELEEHLKTRLLTRSTRKLTLTDAGAAYLSACKVILDAQLLSISASALILDQEGLRVAVVDQGGRVHFKRVAIARDLGEEGRDSD
jgi:DNA-binding transcriptional LysR family regulator